MHREAKRDDDGALTDAWRGALYGRGHPYVGAGVSAISTDNVTVDAAREFRAAPLHACQRDARDRRRVRRRPSPIAGSTTLFADWIRGHAGTRARRPHAAPKPIALADVHRDQPDHARVRGSRDRGHVAERLVAAEMLVRARRRRARHQLGARTSSTRGARRRHGSHRTTSIGRLRSRRRAPPRR